MGFLREIGAFAGLAAFVGLAVLALLYFAQARDVRRLRENASFLLEGPDAADGEQPADEPAPAAAPATRTGEKAAAGKAAAAAGKAATAAPAKPADAEAFRRAELARQAAERRKRFESRRGGGRRFGGRGDGDGDGESRSLPEPSAMVVIVVGAVLLIAGVAFGASRILSGNESGGGGGQGVAAKQVQVAVLNGTSEPGLAAQSARQLKQKGYEIGFTGNTALPFDRSTVMFRSQANQNAANAIATALKINKVEPLSNDVLGDDKDNSAVIVVVGSDKASTG